MDSVKDPEDRAQMLQSGLMKILRISEDDAKNLATKEDHVVVKEIQRRQGILVGIVCGTVAATMAITCIATGSGMLAILFAAIAAVYLGNAAYGLIKEKPASEMQRTDSTQYTKGQQQVPDK